MKGENAMKYTAPEMEMKALDVEDIIMSVQGGDQGGQEGVTPDDEF